MYTDKNNKKVCNTTKEMSSISLFSGENNG
jgi:hypothetical protein